MDGVGDQEVRRDSGLRFVVAGLLSTVLVAGAVIVAAFGLGGGERGAAPAATREAVRLPPQQTKDLATAAERAGCTLRNPPDEGVMHDQREFTAADYGSNPPTSGPHAPDWYADGVYAPGETPHLGMLVHTLEHGRVNVQYEPGAPRAAVELLKAFFAEQENGYHMLLYENATGMEYAVAATAWGRLLGCPRMNDAVIDALRAFRAEYIDKGPEVVP